MVIPYGMDRGAVSLAPVHLQLTTMVQCNTDEIEVRVCDNVESKDSPIQLIELDVK